MAVRKLLRDRRFWLGALCGAVIAAVATFLVLNLRTGGAADLELVDVPPAGDGRFVRAAAALTGAAVLDGNRVEILENGVEIFPAMLAAIDDARQSIVFETFIYWSGDIADRFASSLAERARAGVEVKVLLDWMGSQKMEQELVDAMEQAGVVVERYQPPEWDRLDRFNRRTHRKLLVVDGRVGFTGGVGIGDEWTGDAQDPEHWRDLHFRVEGPVVASLQGAFLDNWRDTHESVPMPAGAFPPLAPAGEELAQVLASSPDEGSGELQLLFLMAIEGARRNLRIGTAYFVPDQPTREALVRAAERGVRVEIIVPGPHIDSEITRRASRADWGMLLEAGIAIHEYQPTMYHSKLLIADAGFATVGSTNFDNRSFRLNDEANLNLYSPGAVGRLIEVFEKDLRRSRRVTLEEWRQRPLTAKLWEHAMDVLGPQL